MSPSDTRETLVDVLSLLTYRHNELEPILSQKESAGRSDRLTSVTLRAPVSLDDIKSVCGDLREQAPPGERITNTQEGTGKYTLRVNYSELDYSKTRFLQRTKREAEINLILRDGEVIIRHPQPIKAEQIVTELKDKLDAKLNTNICSGR